MFFLKIYGFFFSLAGKCIFYLQKAQDHFRRQIAYAASDKQELSRNRIFKEKNTGQKCFILGTGPSLLKHDLTQLANEQVFVVNSFYQHDQINIISPNFYVFADPGFYRIEVPSVLKWWEDFASKSKNLGISFFLPIQLKNTGVHTLLKDEKVYFLDLGLPFYKDAAYKFDPTQTVNGVQNVLVLCIQLAIYMGFKDIYLLGADHDWLTNFMYKEQTHFYAKENVEMEGLEQNHLLYYNWWLSAVNEKFRQYKEVNVFAKDKGVRIYNASEAGVLDVFPWITYKEALKK
ncbi:MAG TPA: 6-hydroxymethylpterin diphosphokinase MptE-like protein [Chitinophagales bacterium]|nr:6-hydroxymethylpterin diphosphokinase MptE-like protein [Chitinophagales bacterium]